MSEKAENKSLYKYPARIGEATYAALLAEKQRRNLLTKAAPPPVGQIIEEWRLAASGVEVSPQVLETEPQRYQEWHLKLDILLDRGGKSRKLVQDLLDSAMEALGEEPELSSDPAEVKRAG